jgi:hypothetical protein
LIGLNDSPPPPPPSPAWMSKGERNSLGYAPGFLVASPSSYSKCALAAITVAHSRIQTWSAELVEQPLGVLQVGGVEALGEPAVDRREEIVGPSALALIAPEATKAGRGTQFERLGLLASRDGAGTCTIPAACSPARRPVHVVVFGSVGAS